MALFEIRTSPLAVGSAAPDVTVADQKGHSRSLANHRGAAIVLFFYPKDDTPG